MSMRVMTKADFKEGDVVSCKAGGPLMTVEDIRSDEFVAAVWFDLEGILHRDCFHPDALQKWLLVE